MPEYTYKNYRVKIGSSGEIIVARGDTVSGYCAAIYQASPASTRPHWSEFGRRHSDGKIHSLEDPNRIKVGETLYHIPSIGKSATDGKIESNQLSAKLLRLKMLREDGLKVYDEVHNELVKQRKDVDNFSLGLDMAGVIATAVVSGWVQVAKAFKSSANVVDDVAKAMLKRSWGVGFQPQNQGVVQGVTQNIISSGDTLTPNEDDHTVVAIGKIFVGSFIDMTSPSYWSKRLAGGDPKDIIDSAIESNKKNREAFLRIIDRSIQQSDALLRKKDGSSD